MYFIGDVHCRFKEYEEVIEFLPESIQVGDFGLGFYLENDAYYHNIAGDIPTHKFFRGNHDNPETCNSMPTCLGDFGYIEDQEIFYMAGAFSIDRARRVEGRDWWGDEELNQQQLQNAVDLYCETKPRIVATHDCPRSALPFMVPMFMKNTSTGQALEIMFSQHQPEIWVFGHHHKSRDFVIENTNFICLAELEVKEIK